MFCVIARSDDPAPDRGRPSRRRCARNDECYCSSGSRMKERFWPGVATGLPWASKPFFSAVILRRAGRRGAVRGLQLRRHGRRRRRRSRRQFERPLTAAAGERQNPGRRRRKGDQSTRMRSIEHASKHVPQRLPAANLTRPHGGGDIVSAKHRRKALPNAYAFVVSRLSQRLASRRTLPGAVPP